MEFYVVVLIFITCMIVLALLIYYCQEYRNNAKYSFTENQRDISAIALAIAAPAFNANQYQPSSNRPPGIVPLILTTQSSTSQPPSPGFVINGTQCEKPGATLYPTKIPSPPPPSPQGYVRPSLTPDDEMSDSGSSSSSKIYYAPHTTAYSIAKRMSVSANVEAMARRKSLQAAIPAQTAAYILAQRLKEMQQAKENVNSENNTPPHRSMSPADANSRSNSQESYGVEMINRRSMSPYIPVSVTAFNLRNKDSRSGSPYTPLKNDNLTYVKDNETAVPDNSNPVPPKRLRKQNSVSQNNSEHLEKKEMAPPMRSENICYPKQNLALIRKGNEDHLLTASMDASYKCPSPALLNTVEEEE